MPAHTYSRSPARPSMWRRFANSLAGRIVALLLVFFVLGEALVFGPAVASFQTQWLRDRVNAAQIAALALEAAPQEDAITAGLKRELLENAGVRVVALKRGEERVLRLAQDLPPGAKMRVIDLRARPGAGRIVAALDTLFAPPGRFLQVRAEPRFESGEFIEIVLPEAPLKRDLAKFAWRTVLDTLALFLLVGALLFAALFIVFVRPMRRFTRAIEAFRDKPEDASIAIKPSGRADEIGRAEAALATMEDAVRNSLRQQARLAALGSAVAKIAHDLRSSLASAQLVTERLAASDDPKVRQAAPRLERSIVRAANLAEAALKFGKAEGPAPDLQSVRLAGILGEATEEAIPTPGAISARIQADPALVALADSDHLHRILVNLLRNGAQAMERAGHTGEILVTARRAGAEIVIDVADQGPGIPDGVRQKLFAPFASGNRDRGGTGLGLAIARELARGMGGDLVLISTSAKGAIFRLTLRASPAAIAAQ